MFRSLWINLKIFLIATLITGVLYPFLILLIAQLTIPNKAQGDIIEVAGTPAGAVLIGQKFESDKYFWPRPSVNGYNTLPSRGSNLGPTSAILKAQVQERRERMMQAHEGRDSNSIPSELLFASGSGLDPHISVQAAYFQISRVARARDRSEQQIREVVDRHILPRSFGILGEPRVNVLLLNQALDSL